MIKNDFILEVDGASIVGHVYLPDKVKKYPLVCFCHGFPSGNPPEPGDGGYPELAERFCGEGFSVAFFNFRGTGDSDGNLDIQGWTHDLAGVIERIYKLGVVDKSHLYLVGFSAGAATSVYVAANDERVAGVAACACPADFSLFTERGDPEELVEHYRSIGAIRDDAFPPSAEEWLAGFGPVTPLNHVGKISPRPLLLVHGSLDETVPVDHARRMYAAAGEPKQLIILEGSEHRLRRNEELLRAVTDWLKTNAGMDLN